MANICNNTFYAESVYEKNLEVIENFFNNWADVERDGESIDVYFSSKWTFPETLMNELFDKIPNKDDIFMRCLSVEYGNDYHELWICDENGWRSV